MDALWKEQNKMEHGTTEEEQTLNALARMNLRINVAYSKKLKKNLKQQGHNYSRFQERVEYSTNKKRTSVG